MRHLIIISIFVAVGTISKAQTRIDIGLTAIPSLSTFNSGGQFKYYKYIHPFNYGLNTTFNKGKFIFSSGILHLTQGTKLEVSLTTSTNPQGTEGFFDVFIRIKAIAIPINADYILISKNKTEIFAGLGLYSGYIYSQQQENTSIPENYQPPSNIIYAGGPPKRFTDLDIFDKYYFAGNAGIGVRRFLNDKWSFQFRPNFLFQIRENLPADKYAWTNRLMTFSFDVGLFYNIKAENKKE